MGTPDFAVASLRHLVEAGCQVVAVITAPDKPAGRGHHLQQSAVKQYAASVGLPVLQPEKLKNAEFLEELQSYHADLQVVVAFRMLPEVVWAMPPLGTFNLHASLLPQYRGAAPINWAIINGETETGVTTFFIRQEIDTGPLLFQETEPIHPDDTAGTLHDRLMQHGAALVLKTVQAIEAGEYPDLPQSEARDLKKAPKIFKETGEIDWNQPAETVRNFVRGLSPYPAAWTTLSGKVLKIFIGQIPSFEVHPAAQP
ncbi:MAG: methionyl-tRNA formyltransferase, partial [Sphingobacteriaceae bacterium]|nr:methionyl-tRNA formyltransferase [Cytophagaceae bacterium]